MTDDSIQPPWPSGRITIGTGYDQIARSIALHTLDLGRTPSQGWVAERVAEHGLPWGEFDEDAWHHTVQQLARDMEPGRAPSADEVIAVRVHHSFGTSSRRMHPLQRWKDILEGTDAVAG